MAENKPEETIVCYAPTMITTNGVWQGDNPLDYSLPLFMLQVTIVVITTRIFVFILKPLRQPRVISEILGGILLGPSVLGRSPAFADNMFPLRSVMVLETMANVGLLYFLFLVGVEMDTSVIRQTGRKAFCIAIAGMILPFAVGAGFSFVLTNGTRSINHGTFILFLGVSLSVTAFPVLARVLAEIKLINTDIGKLALSCALINDIFAWILLGLAIALAENDASSIASVWVILSSTAFVFICIYIVRPLISWMIRHTAEGETFSEVHLCLILTGVMISGFITDAIGTHSIFGAFVFGLVIPNGPLGVTLIERTEDFVTELLLPLFFAISGLKTNIMFVGGGATWGAVLAVIFLACAGKVIGTVAVTSMYSMPLRDGIALGFLTNTKGLVEMIILNVGKDQKVLNDQAFAIMVVTTVLMTGIITPVVTTIYKPTRRLVTYKRRTIEKTKPDSELRVLVCAHTPKHVPTIINLLEASNPTKKSPISIYVLHLVELTGRASAMLIVHNTRKSGRPALNRSQAQSDHIINAFENFEQHMGNIVSIQPLTAISPFSNMHEDICNLAEDKRVALIVLPFHKQQTVDGGMEATNPAYRTINQNVLNNAPCSIGILVDRGLSGSARLATNQVSHHIALLFFGGPDDREALAYTSRMSEHPGISLTVIRFVPGPNAADTPVEAPVVAGAGALAVETGISKEKKLDEDTIKEIRKRSAVDESVRYAEQEVNNGEETVAAIRSMDNSHDLIVVGRGHGMVSPMTAGLTDWSECPELGTIGDLLASSDFAAHVSVLVVQQYVGVGTLMDGGLNSPCTPGDMVNDQFGRQSSRQPSLPPTRHGYGRNVIIP